MLADLRGIPVLFVVTLLTTSCIFSNGADTADGCIYYIDLDGDGFGYDNPEYEDPEHPNTVTTANCTPPSGYADNDNDCNDADADINPDAVETAQLPPYEQVDENCDGEKADLVGAGEDADEDGFTPEDGDCNDHDADVNPDATEVCNDVDDDCDGAIDRDAVDMTTWYADTDGDGYGDPKWHTTKCDRPEDDFVTNNTDCNDTDADINPGATELCDSADNDCDGTVDEGCE